MHAKKQNKTKQTIINIPLVRRTHIKHSRSEVIECNSSNVCCKNNFLFEFAANISELLQTVTVKEVALHKHIIGISWGARIRFRLGMECSNLKVKKKTFPVKYSFIMFECTAAKIGKLEDGL